MKDFDVRKLTSLFVRRVDKRIWNNNSESFEHYPLRNDVIKISLKK